MSDFDPEFFMMAEHSGDISAVDPELPRGNYEAVIDKVIPSKTSPKDGKPSTPVLTINWRLEDQLIEEIFGRESIVAQQKIFLNLNEEGKLDPSNNAQLGRLLVAIGLAGKRWTLPMLEGKVAMVTAFTEEGTGPYEGRRFYRVSSASVV